MMKRRPDIRCVRTGERRECRQLFASVRDFIVPRRLQNDAQFRQPGCDFRNCASSLPSGGRRLKCCTLIEWIKLLSHCPSSGSASLTRLRCEKSLTELRQYLAVFLHRGRIELGNSIGLPAPLKSPDLVTVEQLAQADFSPSQGLARHSGDRKHV